MYLTVHQWHSSAPGQVSAKKLRGVARCVVLRLSRQRGKVTPNTPWRTGDRGLNEGSGLPKPESRRFKSCPRYQILSLKSVNYARIDAGPSGT
jgi:hypothetical protein